jgi:hypothetical protein
MKIKEYKEMMTYLTRPKATQEEAKATWDKREAEFNEERKQKLKADKDMETQVKRTTENNKNPGSFQRLVKEDEAMEKRGQQTVALTNTAKGDLRKQIKNGNIKREDMLLKEDDNGLMVNKNRTIAIRDSFIAKQFNRALGVNDEPQATPEQVGKLAERLERNAQMTGGKGPFTKIADNLGKKPIIKKPIKKTPSKPFKFPEFKVDPMPIHSYTPHTPDPEFLRQERNFNRMVEESNKPKGLPGILGLKKSDYE